MKTVMITGGAKGIGKAIVEAFSAAGYQVILQYYQSEKGAKELENRLSGVTSYQGDLRDFQETKSCMEQIFQKVRKIDVLINNAGISHMGLFTALKEQEWDNLFDTNVKSVYRCCQYVLPKMIGEKQGKIINISSVWGMTGASCEVGYSATKSAIIGLTKALAKEVAPCGIQVNCIAPGMIETDMMKFFTPEEKGEMKEETPLGTFGTPQQVAQVALFLAEPSGDFFTGQVLSPNGGLVI